MNDDRIRLQMASEREKKETEVSRNHFQNVEQRRRLHAIESQIERERLERKECEYAIRRIKMDLLKHFAHCDDPKEIQKAVAFIYDKHVKNENVRLKLIMRKENKFHSI